MTSESLLEFNDLDLHIATREGLQNILSEENGGFFFFASNHLHKLIKRR